MELEDKFMKKGILTAIAVLLTASLALSGCTSQAATGPATNLSFAQAIQYAQIEPLNHKQVSIVGYMATLSPLSGKYMYLMNLPYQSCPFCLPNSTQLANTMAVYAKNGQTFAYTEQAIRVTGTLEIGDYSDEFGYLYNYRIADASYEIVDLKTVSEEYALWVSIAQDGIVLDISAMFDYLYFVCQWTDYQSVNEYEDGTTEEYYLYPGDAENILKDDGPNGYAAYAAEDYFPKLIARVKAIDKTALSDLVEILNEAKALETDALKELSDGNYVFIEAADQYQLSANDALVSRFDEAYEKFTAWIAKWAL
jgi:cell division FtsZ-interacting protein ZapD